MTKHWKYLGIGGGMILAGVVYYTLNPTSSSLFPKCPFFVWTGWKCPGCGSQRAVHALLHGDVAAAWGYNALLVVSLPIIIGLFYVESIRSKYPKLYIKVHRLLRNISIGYWPFRWQDSRPFCSMESVSVPQLPA